MTSNLVTNSGVCQKGVSTTEKKKVNQPLLAATTIIVRDQPDGYEVFMIERPEQGTFPKLHVFPGGKVEQYDAGLDDYCPSLTDERASQILCLKDNGLCFWVGAIRECFEECGVLFVQKNSELLAVSTKTEHQQLQQWARQLSASPRNFQVLLEEHSLTIATDEILYFSHWITPEIAPARFNTRFFLAVLPPEQHADAQTDEVVSACWIRPEVALRKFATKEWQMILPTLTTLRMISNYANANDLIAQVRAGYHKIPVRLGKQLQGMQPFLDQW